MNNPRSQGAKKLNTSADWGREHHWPQVILHIDGDAFFASCEQAVNPELKGKPVVTGKERGIVAAASYEAKAFGVKRGVALWDVKKLCPEAIILPSDYETYSLFSKRMFAIMRRYSSDVEEYGIDEGFMDITGLRRPLNGSYEQIAWRIKQAIQTELGITVSVGMSLTKVLAKIGSKHDKPDGFTVIPKSRIPEILQQTEAGAVWGIGPRTTAYMEKLRIKTAYDFYNKNELFVREHFTKPTIELWQELHGESVLPITTEEKETYASIGKTRTFTPPSSNKDYLFAQLLKNIENACIKARRHNLVAQRLIVYLRLNNFKGVALEGKLSRPTAYPNDLLEIANQLFEQLYNNKIIYRATGVTLSHLISSDQLQMNLFESPVKLERTEKVFMAIDKLSEKYGKHTVHLAGSDNAHKIPQHSKQRGDVTWRKQNRLKGESARKHLTIPLLSNTLT
jgi:DNA polymerase-4/DNA polymerase V